MSNNEACNLIPGKPYNWKNQPERLTYIGKSGLWHQFILVGDHSRKVWCEVLDEHLHMIEETAEQEVV